MGPGESKLANIGINLPGTGELPAPVYETAKAVHLKGDPSPGFSGPAGCLRAARTYSGAARERRSLTQVQLGVS